VSVSTEIEKKVVEIVGNNLSLLDADINHLNKKLSNLELDSMGFIKLVIEIEGEFGIEFEKDFMAADAFETVGSLVSYVEKQLDKK